MKLHSVRAARFLLTISISLIFWQCSRDQKSRIIIENRNFRYEVDKEGKNVCFTDRTAGIDYLRRDSITWCAQLISDGREYNVTDVSMKGNILKLEFDSTATIVEIRVRRETDFINLKVESINGPADELTFLNIPLKLEGMPYEPFAACLLSMNLFTRIRELPALQSNLKATCYKRFGIKGGEATMIGVPEKQILPVIREVMTNAKDIPYSDKGGAWALMQKEGYGSYLMNFGTLTEESVDEWVAMCESLGFNQIDNHGGSDFFRFGDFELNEKKWPGGWDSFKRINKRLHDKGISSIFHTYAFFIDKNSRYVTPVPSEELGYFNSFTLAMPFMPGDSELVVNESTENISSITCKLMCFVIIAQLYKI